MAEENDFNKEVKFHLNIIARCCKKTKRGLAVLATFKRSRYPHFYPRDGASISKSLFLACTKTKSKEKAFLLLADIAKYTLSVQSKNGAWLQKYGVSGRDRSVYKQEDNTAHGITILANYLLAAVKLKKHVKNKNKFLQAIKKAADHALNNYYVKERRLFFSTTSIHESTLERGFTLWTNTCYWNAFNLIERLSRKIETKINLSEHVEFKNLIERSIKKNFILDKRFIARIKCKTKKDLRADITLLSPFYFGFSLRELVDVHKRTAKFVRKELWDKKIGLLQRYLPSKEKENLAYHTHAGNGPWLQYSAMLAQYYFHCGKSNEGTKILNLIKMHSTKNGYLPEHLSTVGRFREFMSEEWKTGIDADKEFDKRILLPQVDFDKKLEEMYYMQRTYYKILKRIRGRHKKDIIRFAVPLSWSHAEYLTALIAKEEAAKKS